MKYFLDTEFDERGLNHLNLISIGIVSEDNREFYAVMSDGWNPFDCGRWVQRNVLPHLPWKHRIRSDQPFWERRLDSDNRVVMTRAQAARRIRNFVQPPGSENDPPSFVGYYADYDWVVFCWLFGRMIDLPSGWPKFCLDVKQYAERLGNPKLPKQSSTEHIAINDARWVKEAWEMLENLEASRSNFGGAEVVSAGLELAEPCMDPNPYPDPPGRFPGRPCVRPKGHGPSSPSQWGEGHWAMSLPQDPPVKKIRLDARWVVQ